jgi:hydrogenase maturation protease
MKTLLLGMGNPILCDDAVGIRLARDFKARLNHKADLDVIEECSVGGLSLLDIFSGYERVIVLDSLRTADGIPGEWYHFTAPALRETIHLTNIHDANFATALALGKSIGMPLPQPANIYIFGVEVKENRLFSESMTPELEENYPRYSSAIFKAIQHLLNT